MQSHQKSFPCTAQYQQQQQQSATISAEKLGHRRRPSIGKSMPVTALLLNFPPPPSESRNYSSLTRDGLSPELEKPPVLFQLDEVNDIRSDESSETSIEDDYEILISDPSSLSSSSNGDIENKESEKEEEKQCLVDNMESDLNSTTMLTNSDYDAAKGTVLVDCLLCNEDKIDVNPVFYELCKKLCDKQCKNSNDKISQKCLKISSKIEEQRRNFLNELLDSSSSAKNDLSNKEKDSGKTEMNLIFNKNLSSTNFYDKHIIAEALAKTSMMTSPAAKRRLAARKVEWEIENSSNAGENEGSFDYEPPRELLLYLVRMGSFNSAPKINNHDSQDDTLEIPHGLSTIGLLQHCKIMRGENLPTLLNRKFYKPIDKNAIISNEIAEGLRVLELNAVSRVCSPPPTSPNQIRILQWNILSQSLGQHNDGFVCCPEEALLWDNRKYLIVEEILRNNPDIICLQEVDHFKFLERCLGTQNYSGIFFPKPDSPCLYIEENNGPDGCAIFYKREKFDLINFDTRILEVWRVQSNQVAIAANFKIIESQYEFCICTTHLKARNGALLSKLRNEQGKDLLKFVNTISSGRPLILCGDFNAEPIEPVYSTVLNFKELNLSSAYADIQCEKNDNKMDINCKNCINNNEFKNIDKHEEYMDPNHKAEILANHEPPYTTWKIREEGEVCHTIDYVFYSKNNFKVNNCLMFPDEHDVGKNRTPSLQYPSDHFSLVCDFEIIDDVNNDKK